MSKHRILVVDDDATTREVVMEVLREEPDIEPVGAASGKEALAAAATVPPDLVLLDLMMPEMDGFALAARLRSLPATAGTPLVAMTALEPTFRPAERARSAGCDALLSKPFAIDDLLTTVRRLLTSG